MDEDLLDRAPLQDRRDDPEFPGAAARAAPHVDVEHALIASADPAHREALDRAAFERARESGA